MEQNLGPERDTCDPSSEGDTATAGHPLPQCSLEDNISENEQDLEKENILTLDISKELNKVEGIRAHLLFANGQCCNCQKLTRRPV
jgi:hypothetical protein